MCCPDCCRAPDLGTHDFCNDCDMHPGCTTGFEDYLVRRYRDDQPMSPYRPRTEVDDERESQLLTLEKERKREEKQKEKEKVKVNSEKHKENQKTSSSETTKAKQK